MGCSAALFFLRSGNRMFSTVSSAGFSFARISGKKNTIRLAKFGQAH